MTMGAWWYYGRADIQRLEVFRRLLLLRARESSSRPEVLLQPQHRFDKRKKKRKKKKEKEKKKDPEHRQTDRQTDMM